MCKFGYNNNEQNFSDQVHSNLTTFIVHINDVNDNVSRQCMKHLVCIKIFKSDSMLNVLQNVLEKKIIHHY